MKVQYRQSISFITAILIAWFLFLYPLHAHAFGVSPGVIDAGSITVHPDTGELQYTIALLRTGDEKDLVKIEPQFRGEGVEYITVPELNVINSDDRYSYIQVVIDPTYQITGEYTVYMDLFAKVEATGKKVRTGVTVPISWEIAKDDRVLSYDVYQVAVSYADAERTQLDSARTLIANDGDFDWKPQKIEFTIIDADGVESIIRTIEEDEISYLHPGNTVKFNASLSDAYMSALSAGLYTVRSDVYINEETVDTSTARFFIPLEEDVEDVVDESLITQWFLKGDQSVITPTWQIVFFGALAVIAVVVLLLFNEQSKKKLAVKNSEIDSIQPDTTSNTFVDENTQQQDEERNENTE